VAEVVGGVLSGSLALLADAGHMLTDIVALGLALVAAWSARRPPDPARTYGYQRAEILAAMFNGIALIVMAVFICVEAFDRFREPQAVDFGLMGVVAVGGLIVNAVGAGILHGEQHSMNLRGAYLHILGDLLGSVGAIVAALLIGVFGWVWADPLTSLIIAGIIVFSAIRLVHDAGNVLMEGTPAHLDAGEVQDCLTALPGVASVHDLHLWTVGGHDPVMSAHLVLDHTESAGDVLRLATSALRERFHIEHSTLQIEPTDYNIINGLTGAGKRGQVSHSNIGDSGTRS
jgi:cobalt-zinc-cadmium efflux system protein